MRVPRTSAMASQARVLPQVGEGLRARMTFLMRAEAARRCAEATGGDTRTAGVAVNIRHALPLEPHGLRLVRAGFFRLVRDGGTGRKTTRKRVSRLVITEKGRAELDRLVRRYGLGDPSSAG